MACLTAPFSTIHDEYLNNCVLDDKFFSQFSPDALVYFDSSSSSSSSDSGSESDGASDVYNPYGGGASASTKVKHDTDATGCSEAQSSSSSRCSSSYSSSDSSSSSRASSVSRASSPQNVHPAERDASPVIERPVRPTRAAASRAKYTFSDSEDGSDSDLTEDEYVPEPESPVASPRARPRYHPYAPSGRKRVHARSSAKNRDTPSCATHRKFGPRNFQVHGEMPDMTFEDEDPTSALFADIINSTAYQCPLCGHYQLNRLPVPSLRTLSTQPPTPRPQTSRQVALPGRKRGVSLQWGAGEQGEEVRIPRVASDRLDSARRSPDDWGVPENVQ